MDFELSDAHKLIKDTARRSGLRRLSRGAPRGLPGVLQRAASPALSSGNARPTPIVASRVVNFGPFGRAIRS